MASMPLERFASNPLLREVALIVRRIVDETLGKDVSFADREEAALAVANEGVRQLLEADLQQMADELDQADELVIEDLRYRRHENGHGSYHSLCGPLRPHRYTFREVGKHNGATVVPLELKAGLIEGATPALAFDVAQGYAEHDMRKHLAGLGTAHRCPPSRTTLEHLAQRIGGEVRRLSSRWCGRKRKFPRKRSGSRWVWIGPRCRRRNRCRRSSRRSLGTGPAASLTCAHRRRR